MTICGMNYPPLPLVSFSCFFVANNFTKIVGTEAWMAPEIILGQAYGASSDVFSYGIGKPNQTILRTMYCGVLAS